MWVHLTGGALVSLLFYFLISEFRGSGEVLLRTCLNIGFMAVLFYGNGRLLVNRYLEKGRSGVDHRLLARHGRAAYLAGSAAL